MWLSDGFVISCGNRIIHAPTLGVHKRVDLDNWLSVSSLTSTAKSKICSVALASEVVSGLGVVAISGRQLSGFPSHVCPFHHSRFFLFTGPPGLAKSAGLSCVGTCLSVIPPFSLILWALLLTNCLYSLVPLMQCKATLLSNHAYRDSTGKPASASCTFYSKLAAI